MDVDESEDEDDEDDSEDDDDDDFDDDEDDEDDDEDDEDDEDDDDDDDDDDEDDEDDEEEDEDDDDDDEDDESDEEPSKKVTPSVCWCNRVHYSSLVYVYRNSPAVYLWCYILMDKIVCVFKNYLPSEITNKSSPCNKRKPGFN